MLRVITGADGTGKSLMACQLLREEVAKNAQRRKEGMPERPLYTNIDGYRYPGVNVLPSKGYDHDWRTLPDGSVVVYDEAHQVFPSTGRPGRSDDPRIREFDEHRHRGFDFYFLTQWPSKIHHEIRQMVQDHRHLSRAFGLARSGERRWTRVQPDPYDEKVQETAEEEIWPHPVECYGDYVSAVQHTDSYKFKMPKKVWKVLAQAVAFVVVGWCLWSFVFKPKPSKEGAQGHSQKAALAAVAPALPAPVLSTVPPVDPKYDYVNAPRVPAVGGYYVGSRCVIFDVEGRELDLTEKRCRQAVRDGVRLARVVEKEGAGLVNPKPEDGDSLQVSESPRVAIGIGSSGFEGQQAAYGAMRGGVGASPR